MKLSIFFKTILIYGSIFIFFTFIYLFSFHLPIFVQQKTLFYRGVILLAVISSIFFALTLIIHQYRSIKYLQLIISAIIVSISLNICFFIVFPVTFDRSITMYLLNTLENQDEMSLSEKGLEQLFIDEYVVSQKAISRRIQEQSIIHFLKKESDQIHLTSKSIGFLNFSEKIKKLYNLE